MENNIIKLCCGGRGCPEVEITSEGAFIYNEHNDKIFLQHDEIEQFILEYKAAQLAEK